MQVLAIKNLSIEARPPGRAAIPIVRGASLEVASGEVVALIGESGSGKTTVCLAALGYLRPGLRVASGRVLLGATDMLTDGKETVRRLRGKRVAYVAQSAAAAFNPALRLGRQVTESSRVHGMLGKDEANARASGLYRQLALPYPETIGMRYPHQVSGGQLQRLMSAMAICAGPELLVLDEPTTALDVTTQMSVLKALKDLIRDQGTSALYVSHDLAVVAQVADRIIVMRNGVIQEEGTTGQIIRAPRSAYTRALMDAHRGCGWDGKVVVEAVPDPQRQHTPLLTIRNVTAGYGRIRNGTPDVVAVRSVDLTVRRGSVLGVIGESGSGKSSLARVIAGLLPATAGSIELEGCPLAPRVDARAKDELRRIQMVFQSPDLALNPAHCIGEVLARPLAFYQRLSRRSQRARVRELLDLVQLPADIAIRRPHELSGGQKQRVNLARALASRPDLILCDEVTSALDTIVGASIIALLRELTRTQGVSILFISHDVSTVASFAEEVAVMYRGEIVEQGAAAAVLSQPAHPYTRVLLGSVPQLRAGWLEDATSERERVMARTEGLLLAD